jgi:cytochrome P450
VAHTNIPYLDALVKEIGRYFVVLRLALPKATHGAVKYNGAVIPPKTLLFLNTWACAQGQYPYFRRYNFSLLTDPDTAVFEDANIFDPDRWLSGDAVHRHQFAFGMGGRMCVASHVASRALYTVLVHLISHYKISPADESSDPASWDPLEGLLSKGNHQAAPAATRVRLELRDVHATKTMLSV